MSERSHDWLVLYRLRFSATVDASMTQFAAPANADIWRFGPENVNLDGNGFPIYKSEAWGGFALYKDKANAQADALNPESAIPLCSQASEYWSALLLPISHKGEVNWRAKTETSSAISTAEHDPGGPLAIVTSAGFASQEPDQFPRIATFTTSADKVMQNFNKLSGNIRSSIYYAMHDQLDGVTVTLWQNDQAMQHAAYSAGYHSELMKNHRQNSMIDRISNTRTRVILSNGSWDGTDPISEIVEHS